MALKQYIYSIGDTLAHENTLSAHESKDQMVIIGYDCNHNGLITTTSTN